MDTNNSEEKGKLFVSPESAGFAKKFGFTPRESAVFFCMVNQMTSTEDIAQFHKLSTNTISNHIKNMLAKTRCENKTNMLAKFIVDTQTKNAIQIQKSDSGKILVVEDSDDDFEILERAAKDAGLLQPFVLCQTAEEALDYLLVRGKYLGPDAKVERPSMIMLDLNLPGMSGVEFLKQIRNEENLKAIPVVVLSSTENSREIVKCYEAGANTFMSKSTFFHEAVETFREFIKYWYVSGELPKVRSTSTSNTAD